MKKQNNFVLFFAQQIHVPWIEGVKNNSIKICELLSQKTEVHIISHKGPKNNKNRDILFGVPVSYLFHLSDMKILQVFHFIRDPFLVLFFVFRKTPQKIFIQYLDTSYILSLIFLKIFYPKIPLILTLYSTDETKIFYKKYFLQYFGFHKIIIISEYLRDTVKTFGYKEEDIVYIPLSFDKERYLHFSHQMKDNKTFLFSAGIVKDAGSFFMVDVAKMMPEYKFIFALRQFNKKSEDELSELQKYILSKSVKNIEILRNIDTMEKLLSEVSALILPLQTEDIKMLIPVALLEALGIGTPVFVSHLPHLRYLFPHAEEVIFFDPLDPLDLKTKILENRNYALFSERGYTYVEKHPSFSEIADKYFQLI